MKIKSVNLESGNLEVVINYKVDELDLKVINFLKEHNYLEIRSEGRTNFDDEDVNINKLEKSINKLFRYKIIKSDYDAWHETYELTKFGKEIINKI